MYDWNGNPNNSDDVSLVGDIPASGGDAAKNADGSPVLDFADYESAKEQAAKLGGTVEAIGVAFRVVTD